MDKLPIYNVEVDLNDDETGLTAISFVDEPATETEWLTFSTKKKLNFDADNKKQMITGVIMLANTPIYRFDDYNGEYFIKFPAEALEGLMVKYMKSNQTHQVNEQHDPTREVKGVYLVESFLLNKGRIESPAFKDVPDGSWMGTFYIEDKEYYNSLIESEEFNGFSLEGFFNYNIEKDQLSKIKKILLSELSESEQMEKLKKIFTETTKKNILK